MSNFVFVHVHRTGGSSIWHNLVPLATQHGIGICDIYHESKLDNGRPLPASTVLTRFHERYGELPTLFHHHTAEPIFELFADDTVFTTVLRDPIDRFVSLVNFFNVFLSSPSLAPQYKEYYAEQCGKEFVRAVRSEVGITKLLDIAASQSYFQNYYITLFSSLCGSQIQPHPTGGREVSRQDSASQRLADISFERFAVIGIFDDLDLAYTRIVEAFGFGKGEEMAMKVSINHGQKRHQLSPAERERFASIFQQDYQFLQRLKTLSENLRPNNTT